MFTQHADLRVCESFEEDSCEKLYLKADWHRFDPNANMDTVMKGLLMNASHATGSHGTRQRS